MNFTKEHYETVAALLTHDGFEPRGDADRNRDAETSVIDRLENFGLSEADAGRVVTESARWLNGER